MDLRDEIQTRLEILPFLLVMESALCYILSYYHIYVKLFTHWESATECSLLMCVIFYGLSKKWGFIAKKSIATLFLLNIVNEIYNLVETKNYYDSFITIIFSFYLILTIYKLCERQ